MCSSRSKTAPLRRTNRGGLVAGAWAAALLLATQASAEEAAVPADEVGVEAPPAAAADSPAADSSVGAEALPEAEARQVGVAGEFHCPGDDPGFWLDWKAAGWIGFGETWDLDTCGEGVPVYAEGANNRWPDMRPQLANRDPKLKPMMSDAEIRYYTTVLPYMAGAVLGLAFLLAWALTFLDRFKKRTVRLVACGECGTKTPIEKVEGGVFCPSCGAAVAYADGADAASTTAGS